MQSFKSKAFRDYLEKSLAVSMNTGQVSSVLSRFDAQIKDGRKVENAFEQFLGSYGSEDAEQATAGILEELEKLNNEKSIDVNPVTRLRKSIDTFNRNIGKLDIEVTDGKGQTIFKLDKAAKKKLKLEMPSWMPKEICTYQTVGGAKTFETVASVNRKSVKLEIEILL